ncbi:Hypothetical protein HDN1F_22180 [gamma proteobacterium HdN1]|nr:Hypothetical protein HDN1F_22180 [gamma proteobacterium HdN1]
MTIKTRSTIKAERFLSLKLPKAKPSCLALVCLPFFSSFTWAGTKIELEAGMEYDSNVGIEEADITSGVGDSASDLSLGISYDHKIDHVNLSASYQLQDTRWQEYAEFNSQLHIGVLRAGYQMGVQGVDFSLAQAYGQVDGKDFLRLTRASPAYSRLIGNRWYVRTQADFSRKDFSQYDSRNSDSFAGNLYLYRFLDRTRFYLSGQMQLKSERAANEIYSYSGALAKIQIKRDFRIFDKKLSSRLHARIETRDYEGWRSDIRAARQDLRYRVAFENELAFNRHWQLQAKLQQEWFDSNLPVADYRQWRASLGLVWEF